MHTPQEGTMHPLTFSLYILPPLLSFYYCVFQATVLPQVTKAVQSCHLGSDTDGEPHPWVPCVVSNHTSPDQLDCGLLYVYSPVSLVICTKPAGNLNIIYKYLFINEIKLFSLLQKSVIPLYSLVFYLSPSQTWFHP